jgi:hypothetical protein
MKKIEDLFFTVTNILSTARKRNVVHVRHSFVCRADDIFEKIVEQSRFEQLTLTHIKQSIRWIRWKTNSQSFAFSGFEPPSLRALGAASIWEHRVPVAALLLLRDHQRLLRERRRGRGKIFRHARWRETNFILLKISVRMLLSKGNFNMLKNIDTL